MSRYSWNVLPLEIRRMAEVEEHFRDELDLISNVHGWSHRYHVHGGVKLMDTVKAVKVWHKRL
jgi:hypothetical protein